MQKFQLKLRRWDGPLSWVWMGIMSVLLALFLLCMEYIGLKVTVLKWMPVPVGIFMVWALLRGEYFSKPLYLLGFAFFLWYFAGRLLLGDTTLRLSSGTLAEMAAVFGFAFLFARVSGEVAGHRFLRGMLTALVLIFAVYAVVSIVASLTGKSIVLPGGVNATYLDISCSRVFIMGLNPNFCAPFVVFGLLFTVYLLLDYDIPWLWIPGGLLVIVFFWTLTLTNSLGARYGLVIAAAPGSAILFYRFVKIRRKWLLVPIMLAGMLLTWYSFSVTGVILTGLVSDDVEGLYTSVDSEYLEENGEFSLVYERRSVSENTSLSGRTNVYRTALSWMKEHPKNLWLGNFESRIFMILGNTAEDILFYGYLHSSLLQTLCVTGIPGLLLALALCGALAAAGLRVLLSPRLTLAEKMLPVLLVPAAVQGLIESFLFVTSASLIFSSTVNLLFFLLAGYVAELDRKAAGSAP